MPDYDPVPAPGKSRVTFVGDSFTAGHGVADVEERFANLIRHREPGWEIHVLAVNGMDTGQELRNLRRSIADGYRLDRVVLVYCLNDAADLNHDRNAYVQSIADAAPRPGLLVRHSYLLDQLFWRTVERRMNLNDHICFGEDKHTLIVAETPFNAHTHGVAQLAIPNNDDYYLVGKTWSGLGSYPTKIIQGAAGTGGGGAGPSVTTGEVGTTNADKTGNDSQNAIGHNNLPPFYGVYFIKRTIREYYTK